MTDVKRKLIVRPITPDGLVGYDEYDQLMVGRADGERVVYAGGRDVRGLTCAICQHGWELTSTSFSDQQHWDLLGEVVHESCLYRHIGFKERAVVDSALVWAKVRWRGLRAVPNQYWPKHPDYDRLRAGCPWYEAELTEHTCTFVIGRRKRVWSVSLRADANHHFEWYDEAKKAFAQEDVTKEFTSRNIALHAWSDAKLLEYVRQIAEVGDLQYKKEGQ